ncbi:MAG: 4-hydroxy-tetrahydrodipicolinate synthase [Bacteroidetes bacterium]|nr:4-hydroxy-tetrahydrodipicolinate synthase [Bacteroidota bacterium]MBV6460151.1 4-hydroxy-tetrahydrodipicolinate synthase [Flavobacteriales bacterium]WKZ74023.1 MAG: 4-hydroxy-tetrahydrodipicolinate synthase [Vicingaceae bacterium]MCL4817403.1 4-hydroxy-tetrahydrodipicolinate synthase [Flavobacteriales bacterium]NOG96059.1 4-hydroxy-tetrahydrodipicolinate synthase [Bacteroidota bacterium]
MNFLRGTGVAIVTPFNPDASVDYTALRQLVSHIINGKADYIVVLGTTGETATLNKEEKNEVLKMVKAAAENKIPLVIGIGGNDTQKILHEIAETDLSGFSAILSVSPYYNKPTQEGIYKHYSLIANHSPLPVILYNVPARTSSNILPETTLRLAQHKNIIAIKEASGNLEQCSKIIKNKPDGFFVISGDDNFTLPLLALGGDGVISVVANAFPLQFSEMVRYAIKNDVATARRFHFLLNELVHLLFVDGNPAGIKCVLQHLSIGKETVRLPLTEVTDITRKKIIEEVQKIQRG